MYNVVESAVGCVPVTFVDPVKDAVSETFLVRLRFLDHS